MCSHIVSDMNRCTELKQIKRDGIAVIKTFSSFVNSDENNFIFSSEMHSAN
jgi:hypothetical protein